MDLIEEPKTADEHFDEQIQGWVTLGGSVPVIAIASRLFQATQGFKTNPNLQTTLPPPPGGGGINLPPFLQQLLNAGINDVIGLINWLYQNGYLQAQQAANSFIQQLIAAGVGDYNSLVAWLNQQKAPGSGPQPINQGGGGLGGSGGGQVGGVVGSVGGPGGTGSQPPPPVGNPGGSGGPGI